MGPALIGGDTLAPAVWGPPDLFPPSRILVDAPQALVTGHVEVMRAVRQALGPTGEAPG